jgi:hypothetical protein
LSSDHDFRDGAAATAPASRRSFMRGAGGLAAAGMVCPFSGARAASETVAKGITPGTQGQTRAAMEGFDGPHQSGILTPLQNHSCFVVFDLVSEDGPSLVRLMRLWTEASRRMMRGQTAAAMEGDPDKPGADSGEAIGLGPSRLSITFGFGAGVFEKDGKDRSTCRASTATSWRPPSPAATCRSRPAPTTRRSRSTRSDNWPGSPTGWRSCAGSRTATTRSSRRRTRRAT